jgi:hypothetical protein
MREMSGLFAGGYHSGFFKKVLILSFRDRDEIERFLFCSWHLTKFHISLAHLQTLSEAVYVDMLIVRFIHSSKNTVANGMPF